MFKVTESQTSGTLNKRHYFGNDARLPTDRLEEEEVIRGLSRL